MEAKVTWQKRMAFTGVADSGFSLPLDTNVSAGGEENGFQPMELFALGLAGCTGMDVISILTKKRQDVTAFEVETHIQRATEHPKVFTYAILEYYVTGHNIEEATVVRAIELSALRYCPAQAMLTRIIPIKMKYHIFEENVDGVRIPTRSGEYIPTAEQAKV